MSNRRQQSLKEAFGARKSTAVEKDNVSSDSELRLSGSESDIADPDVNHTLESEIADSQPSVTSDSSATMPGDEEMEFELLGKPYQPRLPQEAVWSEKA